MPVFTPEHLQLLSAKRLADVAENPRLADEAEAGGPAGDEAARERKRAALARLARYEIVRRRGEVPVRDRYGCADA